MAPLTYNDLVNDQSDAQLRLSMGVIIRADKRERKTIGFDKKLGRSNPFLAEISPKG